MSSFYIESNYCFYLGLKREAGHRPKTHYWLDGEALSYHNFECGEPDDGRNEDCVEMKTNNFKWKSIICDKTCGYICQRPIPGEIVLPLSLFSKITS